MQCQEYVLIKFPGFSNSYGIDVLGFCGSADALLTAEEREQKSKDVALRIKFMQQLVLSTIFGDS
jgi:hypothetical protein